MMKARLFKINNIWFSVLPPQDLFYNLDITDEQFAKKYSVDIYQVELIDKSNWKSNTWIEGEIVRINNRNFFKIKGIQYKKVIKEEESQTLTLIKAFLDNNSLVSITINQYQLIKNVAEKEDLITCYMVNGFCINHKYLIYGNLNKEKNEIFNPKIKIK